jgi:hypothetical protein
MGMRVLGLVTTPDATEMAVLETDGRAIDGFGPAGSGEAEGFLAAHGLGWGEIDLIGLCGEGDAGQLARRTGVPVAFGFGDEAVLKAAYYRARTRSSRMERPAAVIDGDQIILVAGNGLLTAIGPERLGEARTVVRAEDLGRFVGAEAAAYLAARCWNGLPIAFPGTTGAPHPMTAGRIARPQ